MAKTDKDEMQSLLDYLVIRECEDKIRTKCYKICLSGMRDSDIMELHKLINQYLDLIELSGIISRMEN